MRSGLAILGICLALTMVGTAVASYSWFASARGIGASDDAANVPKQEDVPLYPGADDIEVGQVYGRELRHIFYQTEALPQNILAFYQEHLEREGWQLLNETSSSYRWTRHYFWTDPGKIVPWDLDLNLEVLSYQDPDFKPMDPYQAGIHIGLYRSPNLKRIPLYPDAQQVSVNERTYGNGDIHIITTYQTSATPEEVRQYYSSTLINQGWIVLEERDGELPDHVLFDWSYGTIHNSFGANLAVEAKLDSQGNTAVSLEVTGPLRQ